MKIEINTDTTILGLIICLTVLLLGCIISYHYRHLAAIQAGYTEATIPGYSGTVWVKK